MNRCSRRVFNCGSQAGEQADPPAVLILLLLILHLLWFCCLSLFHSVRPLGVLFLGLLSYWLYWTRCSFRVVLTPQLRAKLESWLKSAEDWRRDSPRMFCLVSGGCLASLAILGHLISGSTLVLTLLVLSALVSTRYNFKLLQIEQKGKTPCLHTRLCLSFFTCLNPLQTFNGRRRLTTPIM